MAKIRTCVLVMDSAHARILPDIADDTAEPETLESTAAAARLGEIMADRAGRSFASDGSGRRSAMEPGSDPIKRAMQDFARETLDMLTRRQREGAFDRLAIVASPKMLGVLRDEMPDALAGSVVLEHAANLLKLPAPALRDTLRDMVREASRA